MASFNDADTHQTKNKKLEKFKPTSIQKLIACKGNISCCYAFYKQNI